ncbi:MAG: polyphosphate kinase 1 [Pseudomonadota bacterium]
MARKALHQPELFINRELSWLEFNQRVLDEGMNPHVPLLERLKFLAIVSSNLDEFFMVRVAGLMQQRSADVHKLDPSGLTPRQQLERISERAHAMVAQQHKGVREVTQDLTAQGLRLRDVSSLTMEQSRRLRAQFLDEIFPILTPLAVEELTPCPLLAGLRLHVALVLRSSAEDASPEGRLVVLPVPGQLSRFISVPCDDGTDLVRIEDLICTFAPLAFPDQVVMASAVFRITRDADVEVQEDEAADLLHAIERAVLDRRRRGAVRLEISRDAPPRIRRWLEEQLQQHSQEVYEIDGVIDAGGLMEVALRPGHPALRAPDWPPQPLPELGGDVDPWEVLHERDLLLVHPYDSFDAVVELLVRAAADPTVLAIKQVLYRTSGDSPVVQALERAARAGKQVTVLVELKARFDEARNVQWALRLEDAGCHVVYGIAGLKTHAKAMLIVRRDGGRIRRYVHLATGNYNDRTARLYSDVGLLTCDPDVVADVAAFFNLLTGSSEPLEWKHLVVAPLGLRQRFIDLIEREIATSTRDQPGLIIAKVNSLQDRDLCTALYRASQAGVRVRLNVRGICCLRPGLPGVSETIEVRSIVDRFLEHARVFWFQNSGHDEVYLSSADWMSRNLDRRLELLFPVIDPVLRQRLRDVLDIYFADNVSARILQADGRWTRTPRKGPTVRAQEKLYQLAVKRTAETTRAPLSFKPLTAPGTTR